MAVASPVRRLDWSSFWTRKKSEKGANDIQTSEKCFALASEQAGRSPSRGGLAQRRGAAARRPSGHLRRWAARARREGARRSPSDILRLLGVTRRWPHEKCFLGYSTVSGDELLHVFRAFLRQTLPLLKKLTSADKDEN